MRRRYAILLHRHVIFRENDIVRSSGSTPAKKTISLLFWIYIRDTTQWGTLLLVIPPHIDQPDISPRLLHLLPSADTIYSKIISRENGHIFDLGLLVALHFTPLLPTSIPSIQDLVDVSRFDFNQCAYSIIFLYSVNSCRC